MNLFRSEEHVGRWKDLIPESSQSMPVRDRAFVQGTESRRHWLDEDYFLGGIPKEQGSETKLWQR